MPELPEVENVLRGLIKANIPGQEIVSIEARAAALRTPLKKNTLNKLAGQVVRGLSRRAKYLVFEMDDFMLLTHLGMSGSWRIDLNPVFRHDHLVLTFRSGIRLIYNDPRRFGLVEVFSKRDWPSNRWLAHLGVEPLDRHFTGEQLLQLTKGRRTPIKNLLMDQRRVVGVGNIYASEALFAAGIRPTRPAERLRRQEVEALVEAIKATLTAAIKAGGSTIRDYRNANGGKGTFQNSFQVYDRQGENCRHCSTPIRAQFMAGRSTFWCPQCQV